MFVTKLQLHPPTHPNTAVIQKFLFSLQTTTQNIYLQILVKFSPKSTVFKACLKDWQLNTLDSSFTITILSILLLESMYLPPHLCITSHSLVSSLTRSFAITSLTLALVKLIVPTAARVFSLKHDFTKDISIRTVLAPVYQTELVDLSHSSASAFVVSLCCHQHGCGCTHRVKQAKTQKIQDPLR